MNIPYQPYHKISCGCCTGDGTGCHDGNDRCICAFHQDTPRGRPPHTCAHHANPVKPPLGLRPERIAVGMFHVTNWDRLAEVASAISRYSRAGMPIPSEWAEELERRIALIPAR